jgi:DNA-binding NarL/FixJ family response regulator
MLTTGEEMPAARRVFIVEDHPVIQEAYARFIDREADLVVCGAAFRGLDALRDIPLAGPDLVLVDISLPDMDGLEVVRALRADHDRLPILVVSGREARRHAQRALEAGASGYVDKIDADLTLIGAIRAALDGA